MARIATPASFLVSFLLIGTAAHAEPNGKLAFRYDPSELSTPAGLERLHERIRAYAQTQCRTISTPPMSNPNAARCTRELVEQLTRQIDAPALAGGSEKQMTR